ncbi:hypothetical protein SARC_00385 [Sphaeroforma arctica JP610]|uniref:Mannose-P-dolichol utilization defect 1 protein homolog n=1 Tax=Sphaeroforma arctica JP610 TaxID=667725 RepID=A0A0L0GEQ3_9EUKA|nr:hypothetical protein SARC_00385 [Sphaeroforma arctica JP610]KNC87500.1 hypothetical protein SARC_00385 [Sphaeroforma arctica JP610]|eukprot:XP_014161402.1 hypothetical protein SARC_00385 [Sphaeroforma arctica JP610]
MMKIVSNKSAEGISMLALFLEVINYSVSVVHNLRHNNPLIAWAETLNLTFQNIVLMVLVMVYGKGNMLPGTVMFVAYAGMLFVMQDEQAFTSEYLSIAFAGGTMLTVAARGIQIAAIQSAGHAQNLSFATVALQFGGSVARVFTTIHEMPDDTDMLFAFGAASLLNGVILLQLIYFWNAKAPEVAAKDAEKKTQ